MRKHKAVAESQFKILTVDDDPLMTSAIQAYFQRNGYRVDVENNPCRAIERVRESEYDILLLDFLMSPICGDQVVEEIRKFNTDVFIILLTGHKSMAPPVKSIRELDIQGYYEKSDRFDQLELLVESCVKSIRQMRTIREYQKTMETGYLETVTTLRYIVEARDEETKGHSDRVAQLAAALGAAAGLPDEGIKRLRLAGLFHDIGKIGVPDRILLKPDRLTEEEYAEIKKHPETGEKILSGISRMRDILPIVRGHHERYDGRGYPDGLPGNEIPDGARIIAIADAFDAIVSNRQYRPGRTCEQAMQILLEERGRQFDPVLAEMFVMLFCDEEKGRELRELYNCQGGMKK